MLRNYIIITFRSIQKNGIYTFINITGLSIGLACTLLILLWVNHELSYDSFHEKKQHLHRVMVNSLGDHGIQSGLFAANMPTDVFIGRSCQRCKPSDGLFSFQRTTQRR